MQVFYNLWWTNKVALEPVSLLVGYVGFSLSVSFTNAPYSHLIHVLLTLILANESVIK
jgi:hypothetical protein